MVQFEIANFLPKAVIMIYVATELMRKLRRQHYRLRRSIISFTPIMFGNPG
jgi:hypothetical protein